MVVKIGGVDGGCWFVGGIVAKMVKLVEWEEGKGEGGCCGGVGRGIDGCDRGILGEL